MDKKARIIQLITGDFAPFGAADILLSLINDKMRYHQIKKLKSPDDSTESKRSEQRIEELKEAKTLVTEAVLEAFHNGQRLDIEGNLVIRLIDA